MGPISERFCLFSCFVLFLLFVVCLSVCGLLCLLLSRTVFMYVNDIVSFCLWFAVVLISYFLPIHLCLYVYCRGWVWHLSFLFLFSPCLLLLLLCVFCCCCCCLCVCACVYVCVLFMFVVVLECRNWSGASVSSRH